VGLSAVRVHVHDVFTGRWTQETRMFAPDHLVYSADGVDVEAVDAALITPLQSMDPEAGLPPAAWFLSLEAVAVARFGIRGGRSARCAATGAALHC